MTKTTVSFEAQLIGLGTDLGTFKKGTDQIMLVLGE